MIVDQDTLVADTWAIATPYAEFAAGVQKYEGLRHGMYRTARIPDWAVQRARELCGRIRFLVIAADWCWDAAVALPVWARLGDEAGCLEMRIVDREEHPALMDRYLSNGNRAIPIVIALDESLNVLGHWGPQPTELRPWALANKGTMSRDDFYLEMRRWHLKDRGESVLREILELCEAATQ